MKAGHMSLEMLSMAVHSASLKLASQSSRPDGLRWSATYHTVEPPETTMK